MGLQLFMRIEKINVRYKRLQRTFIHSFNPKMKLSRHPLFLSRELVCSTGYEVDVRNLSLSRVDISEHNLCLNYCTS